MNPSLTKEGVPVLTQQEMSILLALAANKGGQTGYEIAHRCEEDSGYEMGISNGTLYPALKRLEQAGYIAGGRSQIARRGARPRVYSLNGVGAMVLEWQLDTYNRMVRLGGERLRASFCKQKTR